MEKTSEQYFQPLPFTESQKRYLIGHILECRVGWWTSVRWEWLGKLYIMWETLHKRRIRKIVKENKKRITVAQQRTIFQKQLFDHKTNSSDIHSIHKYESFLAWHIWNLNLPLVNPLKAQFFHPLSTNLLYWAHNSTILGLSYKPWPYTISIQIFCMPGSWT